METAAAGGGSGSDSHPPVKKEDVPVPVRSSLPTPEKGEEDLEGDEKRREGGAFTRAHMEKEVAVAAELEIPTGEVEDEVTLAVGDITAPMEKEEGTVAEGSKSLTPEAVEEIAEKYFQCRSCRNLLNKPLVVIECGHMFCVGCAQDVMNIVEATKCFVCGNIYNHLPRCCELIQNLVTKLQPIEKIEATKTFSLMANVAEDETVMEPNCYQCAVQVEDVSCVLCNDLLYQPAVLNCGHVFCISCISFGGEEIKCPTCSICHPSGVVAVCKDLDGFIQDFFPSVYTLRIKKCQPFSGTISRKEITSRNTKLSQTHVGVGCDFCGVYPITGDRYSCKTCIKFDLCENCAKTDCPDKGRSGQMHSPDHVLELDNTFLLPKVLAVLDNQDNEEHQDNEGAYEFQPARWVVDGGLMRWDDGQQAPQD